MLVLTRYSGEAIRIGGDVQIVVKNAGRGKIRVVVNAPPDVIVHREEVYREVNGLPALQPGDDGYVVPQNR